MSTESVDTGAKEKAGSNGAVQLRATGLSKTFGVNRVLNNVDLEIRSHEIRGLLGQNGSGKSTLIKILAGYHTPDPGAKLEVAGEEVPLYQGEGSQPKGIAFVHQDLGLVKSLSIVDNFWIGTEQSGGWMSRIRWRRQRAKTRAALQRFGLRIDVRKEVEVLPDSHQAVVAIARALESIGGDGTGVLVLDEPTAHLEHKAKNVLFDAVRSVAASGCGVLFVSHNLDEVRDLCTSVTVLRDGNKVAEGSIEEMTESKLIQAIVGRDIESLYPEAPAPRNTPVALSVKGLSGIGANDITFDIHEGEVLGLCGLSGMGQDVVPRLIYGVDPPLEGEVRVGGEVIQPGPRQALEKDIVFLPVDRLTRGGHAGTTVRQNLTLPVVSRYFKGGFIRKSKETEAVDAILEEFAVKPPDSNVAFGNLSGGNQQKALLGKWMSLVGKPKILLMQEPTQGVDIGARHDIFQFIQAATEEGAAVLYASTEFEDLAHLCDRVLIMRYGRIVAEVGREELTAERLEELTLSAGLSQNGSSSTNGSSSEGSSDPGAVAAKGEL